MTRAWVAILGLTGTMTAPWNCCRASPFRGNVEAPQSNSPSTRVSNAVGGALAQPVPRQEPPLDTALSPSEIWRRLLRAALTAKPIYPADIQRIFGVKAGHSVASYEWRQVKLRSSPATLSFLYQRWSCDAEAKFMSIRTLCIAPGSVVGLLVDGPFTLEKDRQNCPNNEDVSAALSKQGWSLYDDTREIHPTFPDQLVQTPERLVRRGGEIHITPPLVNGKTCLMTMELYLFVGGR
jgi:hypothetical protein